MPQHEYLNVELQLISGSRATLRCPGQQDYADAVCIDENLSRQLRELEHSKDFQGYGQALFEATFPSGSELRRGIYSLLDSSRRERKRLRLRLFVERAAPVPLHSLHWELLTDGRDLAIGRSPETVFSRYISRPHALGPSPTRPRMLCAIAAPTDIERYGMAAIDYDGTLRQLDELFAGLSDSLRIDFLHRPVSPERLREQLSSQAYHLLHIYGHGALPSQGESALVLEDSDYQVRLTTESALASILLGLRDLELVTLIACHGGAPSAADDGLSGLAGSLVMQNVPAVIAMRRAISMKLAFRFTQYFYRRLAQTPCVDEAVNEARHQLYLADPEAIDWSSPMLYMRLEDGQLWSPRSAPDAPGGETDRDSTGSRRAAEGSLAEPEERANQIIRADKIEGQMFLGPVGEVNNYKKSDGF